MSKPIIGPITIEDDRYQDLIQGLNQSAIVSIADEKGNITFVNDMFIEVTGYSREELIGANHRIVNSGFHSKEFFTEMWATIKLGKTWKGEVCNRKKDGSLYWVSTAITSNLNEHGETQYMSIRFDITEQKLAARKIAADQEKFQQLIQGLNQSAIVSIADEKGNITFVNDMFIEVTGYSKEELIGANHRIVNSGFHPKEFFTEMWTTIKTGKAWKGEVCNRKKDGSLYWVSTAITSNLNEHGETQYMSIRFDITEQKLNEIKLHESDRVWRSALDGSGDGVWDWDILNDKIFFSKRWKEMLGFVDKEFGDNFEYWKNQIHSDDLEKTLENIQAHFLGGDSFNTEYRVLCKNGSYKWILARGMVISRDIDESPLRMIGTHTDISKIKQAQQQLVQTSKMASLGELAAGMAHEINNPLTIISSTINLLPKHVNNPEKFAGLIDNIQKSSKRIAKIVNGLKKFSRSSEESNYSHHDLSGIAREAIGLAEAKAKKANVPVICDLCDLSLILCDEIEIEQVLINLINNAIDAVKNDGDGWVKVDVREDGDVFVLRVIDSGHGIPEKVREKLFEPFFTTKPIGEGTGLGLSIIKGILDQHGATIDVVSSMPNTCFEVRFLKAVNSSAA